MVETNFKSCPRCGGIYRIDKERGNIIKMCFKCGKYQSRINKEVVDSTGFGFYFISFHDGRKSEYGCLVHNPPKEHLLQFIEEIKKRRRG